MKIELYWEGGIDWSHLEPETGAERMGIWNVSRIEGKVVPKCRAWVKVTTDDGKSHLRSIESSKDLMKPQWYREIQEATGKVYDFDPRRSGGPLVYFILDRPSNAVKIGYTNDLKKRFGHLQMAHATDLILLESLPGDRTMEAEIHLHFKEHRLRGEWFDYNDVVKKGLFDICRNGWTRRRTGLS